MRKLFPILLLLAICVLGCNLSSIKDRVMGGSSGTATGSSDPKAAVTEASRKFLTLPSYTAHMNGSGTQGDMKNQLEYVQPDKFHMTTQGGPGAGMEMIGIGDQLYMKIGDSWTKSPGDTKAIASSRAAFSDEGLKTLTDVSYEGNETIDNIPAQVYKYRNVTPTGNFGYGCKMWVSAEKGVPVKLVCDYDNGVLKQMTITYDLDTPVTIEAPIAK